LRREGREREENVELGVGGRNGPVYAHVNKWGKKSITILDPKKKKTKT
jgi:hypothetical protein